MRFAIFVGPVIVYLRYVEKTPVLAFLKIKHPRANYRRVLPLTGALFVAWYLLLDAFVGDGRIGGAGPTVVLFVLLSPATLAEEVFFRGFLPKLVRQTAGFWRANLGSALLFGLIHLPGWHALGNFSAPIVVAIDFVGLVVFGMVFGLAMRKTGSLWSAYLAHALNNLLIVAVLGA